MLVFGKFCVSTKWIRPIYLATNMVVVVNFCSNARVAQKRKWHSATPLVIFLDLILKDPSISESCIEIKI